MLATAKNPAQALLVVDVQPSFEVPDHIVTSIQQLARQFYTVATVERHDESVTPIERQLGWKLGANEGSCSWPTVFSSSMAIFRL
jgi:hypothetical protein